MLTVGEGESRSAWAAALADRPWESGTLVKQDGARAVWRATVLGSSVSVKVRPVSRLRVALGSTDFGRSVRAAKQLERIGIETAPVFAHAVVGGEQVLVNAWLEGPTLLEIFAEGPGEARTDLVRAVGTLIGTQLRHALFNRDHKPSNLIVTDRATRSLAMVDVGGVRRIGFATSTTWYRLAARMGASICLEPSGVGYGLSEEEMRVLVDAVVIEAATVWSGANAASMREGVRRELDRILASHGDPTPRINPLEPPSGT
ncbi:MAG: hypothetical protein AAGH71_02010 [Planctomycetota bacterium]